MESSTPVRLPDTLKTVKVDTVSASVTYVGVAAPGASAADAVWQIKKLSKTGTVLSVLWADGNVEYDNVWDNRTGLTYL